MKRKDPISILKGIGVVREQKFAQVGIRTLEDLLYYYPRRYEDQSRFLTFQKAVDGEKASFKIKVLHLIEDRRIRKGLTLTSFAVTDGKSEGTVVFFNQSFIKNSFSIGSNYYVYGKVKRFKGRVQLTNPEISPLNQKTEIGGIKPIYPLSKKLTNREILLCVDQILDKNLFEENLPKELLDKFKLIGKNSAIKSIHRPQSRRDYIRGRQRLIFEELLIFQLAIRNLKLKKDDTDGISFQVKKFQDPLNRFLNSLPFQLTPGQQKVLQEIQTDMEQGKSIHRLIQGDVGSGKTIVAMALMYLCSLNGYQSSIMAPTEILAKQHYQSFCEILKPLGLNIALLIGSTSGKEQEQILNDLKNGQIDILVGTHAIIEDRVQFNALGMNIIDEQHRFGVVQRDKLYQKNKKAAFIIMSATPIPRTLSLILYADMDISIIDTMPQGRIPIQTTSINDSMLESSLLFLENEMKKGRQIYVICPLIEENEELDNLWSVEEVYEALSQRYRHRKVALLHGKMKNDEKNQMMEDFVKGDIDLMVSTTVIEVGVNVPNATVMFVVNAERFGLAQLHQLRGRVGRGKLKSYCILYNRSNSDISWQRMKVMTESTDGFYIANKDLELRGFGDILGTRQSGIPNLRLANPLRDVEILQYAADEAINILMEDPSLTQDKYRYLKRDLQDFYKNS
ncbi:MAG: ATP-dependent DNA helicase RecG [Tissierellia bacterium]|nr:ATP-dependent DNA helicase RecG [Tissierellia bacterium]